VWAIVTANIPMLPQRGYIIGLDFGETRLSNLRPDNPNPAPTDTPNQ